MQKHVGLASTKKQPNKMGLTSLRKIPDILSWTQCFGIYVSVIASKYPTCVPQMLAYQTTFLREARRCGGAGWYNYDSSFRQQAACNPKADWSKINSSLYALTFTSKANGRGKCCQFCLEADHTGADCALSPTQRPDWQERQRSTGLGLPAKSPEKGADPLERGVATHMVALRIAVTCTPEGGSQPNRWCATPTMKGRAGSQAHAGTSTSARSARLRTTPPAGAPPTRRQVKGRQNRQERVSVRS